MRDVERLALRSASGVRRMREVLAARFLGNRDKTRLFRVRLRSEREEVAFEGYPSTSTLTDPHLKFRIPGVRTLRLLWDHIVGLEEVDDGPREENTSPPEDPFGSLSEHSKSTS